MGQFSWKFCDKKGRLKCGGAGVLLCPNGKHIAESCYGGYGVFGTTDAYEAVARWNREFLAKHPEFVLPSHCTRISNKRWYKYYADLTLSLEEAVEMAADKEELPFFELRNIGIDIACYDEDNSSLMYPIKIASKMPKMPYEEFPASDADPDQGW